MLPRKKKQALRPSLQSLSRSETTTATPEPVPSTSYSESRTDDDVSLCGVCRKSCKEEEECESQDDYSLGCDGKCKGWFHYKCVGVTGTEPFLFKAKSKWYCPNCLATKKPARKKSRTD